MENILVATDGSDHAKKAIELASTLSTALNAQLNIVHVFYPGILTDSQIQLLTTEFSHEIEKYISKRDMEKVPASPSDYLKKHQELAGIFKKIIGSNILDSAVALSKENSVSDPNTHLRTGNTAENILSVAKAINADLIVIGNRGQGEIKSPFMGRVSSKVHQEAEIPVLIVK